MMNSNMNRRNVQYRQDRQPMPQPAVQPQCQPSCQTCPGTFNDGSMMTGNNGNPQMMPAGGPGPERRPMPAPDHQTLMNEIYQLGFAIVETVLYLDTHPSDADALNYYNQIKRRYSHVMEMYSREYGPLLNTNVMNDNYWSWVATPMPWEVEGC